MPPLVRTPHPRHYGSLSGCELLVRDIATPPPDVNTVRTNHSTQSVHASS
ncbi:BZ3500_MvSof-1268-A1-R1_Chr3-1g05591 [Microbotryum saponariae]|uniref:BZ3500_MvSof-1268-A1-R1_Chr3-1g05591 protein n=1 Tax=Microbotryum saponariae TaxID=289078 RepID=A0A2X0LD53_9BASI|nr:BZ3500_MvSof-1268-A1-R1_Chr3-1g05591 [Microbotryum saponariae]SDA04781.1 BZ3501_MvSof-1269-A2-R1_Chr3-1g05261 [Microbotryum saponariae]